MSEHPIGTKEPVARQVKSDPPIKLTKSEALKQKTVETVLRFFSALGNSDYDIGVLKDGKMQRRTVSMEYFEFSNDIVNFWRSANAAGGDIYVAPARAKSADPDKLLYPAIILIDDLEKSAISKMRNMGYAPCAVVETSPNNYQAWVHVTSRMYDARALLTVSRFLAEKFGGDPRAALPGQYGRLPGFTNRKQKYARRKLSGKVEYPFSHLYYAFDSKRDEKRFPNHVESLLDMLSKAADNMPRRPRNPMTEFINSKDRKALPLPRNNRTDLKAQNEVDTALKSLINRYGANYDASRGDWMVITNLLRQGLPDTSIAKALLYSPEANLLSRKADVGYYLNLTFMNAYKELINQGENIPPLSHEFSCFIESISDTS